MQQNYTRDALYHPETLPVFPNHRAHWKFKPMTQEFSLINAWWLCNLSQLAYFSEADGKPVLQAMGLTLEAFIDDRKKQDSRGKLIKDTQAYLVSTDDVVILSFRGTEPDSFKDVLADAYLHPTDFPRGGKVHSGFYGALSGECWQEILSVLERPEISDRPLWITGHSLGAALATIAAALLKPAGVYTFASPRVGNSIFCALFNDMNSYRFVNCSDLVTQIPIQNILDYQHVDSQKYFDAQGDLIERPSEQFIKNDTFKARMAYPFSQFPVPFFTNKVLFRTLADHSIINYQYAVWKNL